MNKIGEYELNRVYCEDSYEAIKKLPDKSIDCIYTDIPYLYEATLSKGGGRIGKGRDALYEELKDIRNGCDLGILDEFVRVLKKINLYIWCSKAQIFDILSYFIGGGGKLSGRTIFYEILTWNKTNPTPATNQTWLPDIEYCLYFKEQGVLYNDGFELKSKWYSSPANVADKRRFEHPTCKPLRLVERHLLHTTQPNDIVADFFLGSGTTAVACKNIDRQYIGFEINPKWHKIAEDRLNNIDANGQMSFITF